MTMMAGIDVPTVNDAGLYVTARTYALYSGITHSTACELCRKGKVPATRVGKQWRIPVEYMREQLEGGK